MALKKCSFSSAGLRSENQPWGRRWVGERLRSHIGVFQQTDNGWCPKHGPASALWIQAVSPTPGPDLPPQHDLGSRKGSACISEASFLQQVINLPGTHRGNSHSLCAGKVLPTCTHQSTSKAVETMQRRRNEEGRKGKQHKKPNRRTREIKRTQDSRRRKDLPLREEGLESPEVTAGPRPPPPPAPY